MVTKKKIKSPAKKKKPAKRTVKKTGARKIKLNPSKKKTKKPAVKVKKQVVVGIITHYFPKVRAAVLKLKIPLSTNDKIKIKGHTTDFEQIVTSIQIDKQMLFRAKKGQTIGLLVDSRVRHRDIVYKE